MSKPFSMGRAAYWIEEMNTLQAERALSLQEGIDYDLVKDMADEIGRLREFINSLDIQNMHAHMNGEHQCSIRASGRCLTRDQWAIVLDCRERQ